MKKISKETNIAFAIMYAMQVFAILHNRIDLWWSLFLMPVIYLIGVYFINNRIEKYKANRRLKFRQYPLTTNEYYDGEKIKHYLLDEFCMWDMPKGKVFKIWKLFYLYYEKTFFWFRFFGGYGVWGRGKRATMYEMFSERSGNTKYFKLFGWKLKILKPSKI